MVRWQLMSPLLTIVSTLFQHAIRLGFWSPQGLLDGAGRHGAREVEIELLAEEAPITFNNFMYLAQGGILPRSDLIALMV